MSEQDTLPADVHPEAALLPWFANGTLPVGEREQIMRHLERCGDCRRELDELSQMKQALTEAYRTEPIPSPRLSRSVLAKVAEESATKRPVSTVADGWMDELDQWFRSLFLPRWVPTLAAMLLAVQFGLLFWLTNTPPPSEPVTTRAVAGPTLRVRVTFQEQATVGQIRAVLESVRAQILEGPDGSGSYLLRIPGTPDMTARALQLLKSRSDVVSNAEPTAP